MPYQTIAMTAFAAGRHFGNPEFAGTKITNVTPDEFITSLTDLVTADDYHEDPGYAGFCKHLFVRNFTDALMGVAEITDLTRPFLRTGYGARRDEELPVLSTWFERTVFTVLQGHPDSPWLDVILYSASQCAAEGIEIGDAQWGIVSINSATAPSESPMKPITMMRNALGKEQGGSGKTLDPAAYAEAVAFWSTHATIR
jgi:hypothetical protein